jgi:ethanolamine utilization protein EutA
VVHIDIGGGTSNFARIENGKVAATACLNVGGRLVKLENRKVVYLSPVLNGLTDLAPGQVLTEEAGRALARMLVSALEMAVGLRPKTALFERLTTAETKPLPEGKAAVLSFSGGVAACMEQDVPWDAYGDLGPLLGAAILESELCKGEYRLGQDAVRATVIGAGCHSTQLSGSTVYLQNVELPLKNLPVVAGEDMAAAFARLEGPGVLWLAGLPAPGYGYVTDLADRIVDALGQKPCYIALQADMAKALGTALRLRLGAQRPIICIDSVAVSEGCYLDLGKPVGEALPVVVKTLAFAGASPPASI